jgi:DNA-directed RNA polymerase subunit RPC12/RpoP
MGHPFKLFCKHAQYELDNKFTYSKIEYHDCGGLCWRCDKPLTESQIYSQYEDISEVNMSDNDRKSIVEKGPDKVKEFLYWLNNPPMRYKCIPCFKQIIDERRNSNDHVSAEELLEDLMNPAGQWYQDMVQLIKEVEECGSECVYWDRLPMYRKNIESRFGPNKE